MKRIDYLIIAVCVCLFCWQCSTNLTSGGSSEVEGFTVAGRVVDASEEPVSGVSVMMFSGDSLVQPDSLYSPLDSTATGTDGWYTFKKVGAGSYSVQAMTIDSTETALQAGIAVADNDTLPLMTLDLTASITGQLPSGFPYTEAKSVILAGTPFRGLISDAGSFSLSGIAAGTYTVALILPGDSAMDVVGTLDTITVTPSGSLDMDTLHVPVLGSAGTLVVDDFSDCNMLSRQQGIWWFCDDDPGGNSVIETFEVADSQEGTGGCAAHLAFTFGYAAPFPYVGIGTYFLPHFGSLPQSVNLENATGISFRLKGSGAELEVLLQSYVSGIVDNQGFKIAPVPETWTVYTFNIATDMADTYEPTDPRSWQQRSKAITHIQFDALPINGTDTGEIWIDDVEILYP
jgi:hypothetical protein